MRGRIGASGLVPRAASALADRASDSVRARGGEREVEVLLVCTGGGHLLELWLLRAAWDGYERAWVVGAEERSEVAALLAGEQVHYAYSPAARSVKNLLRNLALAVRLLRRLRPRVVLTTGAAVAVPFAWMARLRRIPVAYIESLARAERPSLSCRLVAPIADRVYVQWPELRTAVPRARYAGTVLGGCWGRAAVGRSVRDSDAPAGREALA